MEATFTPDPPATGEVRLDLRIEALDGHSVTGVTVDAWMEAHGHGLSDPPEVSEQGGGDWAAEWICPMAGAWTITVGADGVEVMVFDVDFL